MTETEAIQLFKCLSDKSRLQILKSLAIEDMYVERLRVAMISRTPPAIWKAVAGLYSMFSQVHRKGLVSRVMIISVEKIREAFRADTCFWQVICTSPYMARMKMP